MSKDVKEDLGLQSLYHLHIKVDDKCELPNLNRILFFVSAPLLYLNINHHLQLGKKRYEVLSTDKVEVLEIMGPCCLQFRPNMSRLRSVITQPDRAVDAGDNCTFRQNGEQGDGWDYLHCMGQCVVDVRALWQSCPNAHTYDGISIPTQDTNPKFSIWINNTKKEFFKVYKQQGGEDDLKT